MRFEVKNFEEAEEDIIEIWLEEEGDFVRVAARRRGVDDEYSLLSISEDGIELHSGVASDLGIAVDKNGFVKASKV